MIIIGGTSDFATISLETKFLYPVKQGVVTAKATVANQSGKILQGFSTVYNEENRAVLEFSSTFKMAKEKRIRDIAFQDDVDSDSD